MYQTNKCNGYHRNIKQAITIFFRTIYIQTKARTTQKHQAERSQDQFLQRSEKYSDA